MANQEDKDLQRAIEMSLQPFDAPNQEIEVNENEFLVPEILNPDLDEFMLYGTPAPSLHDDMNLIQYGDINAIRNEIREIDFDEYDAKLVELTPLKANRLFSIVFGFGVSKQVLVQWNNQGIRFSTDPETCIGLVQHQGGPCGVLAAIQAFLLKYILFLPEELDRRENHATQNLDCQRVVMQNFSDLTEDMRSRALLRSMTEILFRCGSNRKAVIADLCIFNLNDEQPSEYTYDEVMEKELKGFCLDSPSVMQNSLRIHICVSEETTLQRLQQMLPVFRSRVGALLFLISAILSRGMDYVQADRDDPSIPLVTGAFGHTSQDIVNLLLCGEAVSNVFDGNTNLVGGMYLKGISSQGEVGFLTLFESTRHCAVGHNLKCPKWPIWIVGSESHYTVLYALDPDVQSENAYHKRKSDIRRVFDAQGDGRGDGFISQDGLRQVLRELNLRLPPEKINYLCTTGMISWDEFWQTVLDLEESLGGLKDSSILMGKRAFDLFHFNGFAKMQHCSLGGDVLDKRPRLTKVNVSIPPNCWTGSEAVAKIGESSTGYKKVSESGYGEVEPLVKCIRTRWPGANCSWVGGPPSII